MADMEPQFDNDRINRARKGNKQPIALAGEQYDGQGSGDYSSLPASNNIEDRRNEQPSEADSAEGARAAAARTLKRANSGYGARYRFPHDNGD